MRLDKIEIAWSKGRTAYWKLIASNNKVLAVSEMYDSARNCRESVRNLAARLNQYGPVVVIKDRIKEGEG